MLADKKEVILLLVIRKLHHWFGFNGLEMEEKAHNL